MPTLAQGTGAEAGLLEGVRRVNSKSDEEETGERPGLLRPSAQVPLTAAEHPPGTESINRKLSAAS